MTEVAAQTEDPNLAEVRKIVADLFEHRPMVYWLDLVVSAGVAWTTLMLAIRQEDWGPATWALCLVSAFAFLRAVLFIHEISHFRRGVMPGFAIVWNLIVGLPMLLPSFMYVGTHTDHHKRHLYGTIRDPEYLPLAHLGRWATLRFVLEMPLVPLLLVLRYGLLTPLSWVIPPLRRLVVGKLSALVINPAYDRRPPEGPAARAWLLMETLLLAWIAVVASMVASGAWPWRVVLVWYLTAAMVATINQVRTLVAHHYENDGRELSTLDQLADSVNVRGWPFVTELVFPVGLRYHGLHHWLADMPYHGLYAAHRRLVVALPPGATYHRTVYAGVMPVIARLWKKAGQAAGRPDCWKKKDD
ncbi:MAG: fatty acid desaturase [Planctomycetes bacterium]|nr:fatty acid desaturase [Planctomycetota bacterium]